MVKNLLLHRYPSEQRDFASMGHGIEARYERCKYWWDAHLHCCREFIADRVPACQKLLIIGAGRLLDIDLHLLSERCKSIYLLDADPSCHSIWERQAGATFGDTIHPLIGDCTDALQSWTSGLAAAIHANSLGNYLQTCRAPLPAWSLEPFDGIISLNILGQIPLYWRDRVLTAKSNLREHEQHALAASMGELQRAHLEGLISQSVAWSMLITDTEYYFYHCDKSNWRIEPALYGPAEGLEQGRYFADGRRSTWFWHVSPQFVECDDEGEIHRVEAFFRPAGNTPQ